MTTFQQSPARAFVESPAHERNRGGATQRSVWGHYQWPGLPRNAGFASPDLRGTGPVLDPAGHVWPNDGNHYLYFRSRLSSFSYFEAGALYITRQFREFRHWHHPLFYFGGFPYKTSIETSCDGVIYTSEVLDDGTETQSRPIEQATEQAAACVMLDRSGDDGFGRNVSYVRTESPAPNILRNVYVYDPGGREVFPASPTADTEFISADSEAYTADSEGLLAGDGGGLLEIIYEWEVGAPMSWPQARAQAVELIDTIKFEAPSKEYLVTATRSRAINSTGPYLVTGEIRKQRAGERFTVEWLRYKNPFPTRPEFDAGKLPVIFAGPEDPFAYPTVSNFPLGQPHERAKSFVAGRDQLYFDLAKQVVPGTESKKWIEELSAAVNPDSGSVIAPPFREVRRRTQDGFAAVCNRYRQVGGARQYHPQCIATPFGGYLATVRDEDSPLWP